MKKLTAILLLALFLFNLFGYRAWFYFAQHQSEVRLESALDKDNYDDANLITIKIPLSLPYFTNWKEFERVDGEVTLDGKIYRYVKRKVQDDQLILLCLPDNDKMHLESAKNDFFKYVNDLQQNASSKKSSNTNGINFKNVLSDYDKENHATSAFVLSTSNIYLSPQDNNFLSSITIASPEQPPETHIA